MTNLFSQQVAPPSFADVYERLLVPVIFRPCAEATLAAANVRPGERVIDVACGTGIVARLAREIVGGGGAVVGVDASPEMIAAAATSSPLVDLREGRAESLPLKEGESFDVVVCQQGLQFVPDRAAACGQFARALTPGGRVVVATWRPIEEAAPMFELQRIAERHVGPIADVRHSLGDAELVAGFLRGAGFVDVEASVAPIEVVFADGLGFIRINTMPLMAMSRDGANASPEEKTAIAARIVAESMDVLRRHGDGKTLRVPYATNVVRARLGM